MSGSTSASSHDSTHTDMLLPGVHGEAAEEEASMLQPTISHQTESNMLQPSLTQDPSLLQQSISHQGDPGLLQQTIPHHISHTQGGEETLIQSEDLAGMQLITGDCNTVLQCDLSSTQTQLSVEALAHSAASRPYNETNTNSVTALSHHSSLHCDLSGVPLSSNPNTNQLPIIPSENISRTAGKNCPQNAQPTFMTTTVPISSLLQVPAQQQSSENISDSKRACNQSQSTVKPATVPSILQQAIALNTNLVTALANLPFLQTNQPQSSTVNQNQTQNLIPVTAAPATGVFQAVPTNIIRNYHIPTSTNQLSNIIVPTAPGVQRIQPNTQKPSDSAVTSSCSSSVNIQMPAVLSGSAMYCAPGSSPVTPIDSALLPHILNSINTPFTSSSVSAMLQQHLTQQVSNLTTSQSVPSVGMSNSLSTATHTTASSGTAQSAVLTSSGIQHSGDNSQPATYLSQFPMPMPVMSTQETSTLPASNDLQSFQACLSHPLIQSLSQQSLVTSLASQIVFSSPRCQATTSPSFPHLAQTDVQQTAHLLRQSVYNISDSDTSTILSSLSGPGLHISSNPTNSMDSYTAPPPSSLSPILPLPSHFPTSNMMPNVALSPSETITHNLPTRLYLTSPMTVVPLSHDSQCQEKTDVQEQGETTGPAFTLANMSVIDMLLKHPTDLPDVDRAALPDKEIPAHSSQPPPTPKLTGIYCVECNNSYKDGCTYHKMDYTHIEDRPVPPRATLTLPSCLSLQMSGIKITAEEVNILGVFASQSVSKKTEFGPLIGKVVSEDRYTYTNSFTWKIFYSGQHSVVDVSDEEECNWLMYMKPAPSLQEQNVVVYQRSEHLYFVTNKNIEPGTELLFWFAKDYAKLLGLPVKPSQLWPSNCPFCHICNKVFSDWKVLSKHMKSDHPNASSRKWPCHVCNRRFTTSTKLKTHMVALHMRLKPFSCQQCGKKFSDQSNLRQHQNIHTGERRFKCSICSKTFRQKAHLQSHMIIHTGTAGLQCRFCEAKIARPSDLKSHELKHTKEKCYPCALCVKVFYKLANYKKHMLVHNKERNFMCMDCGKTFYSKYHLTRHLKTCKNAKTGERIVQEGGEDNLYRTLEGDPQAENDDNMILRTSTGICAPLRAQRQDR